MLSGTATLEAQVTGKLTARYGNRMPSADWAPHGAYPCRGTDEWLTIVVQNDEQAELCRRRLGRDPIVIPSIAERAEPRSELPEAFLWIGRWAEYKRLNVEDEKKKMALLTRGHPLWLAFTVAYLMDEGMPEEAGRKLDAMLQMGLSRRWQDALEAISGKREMDATAIRDYFAPLQKWLDEQNRGKPTGW